MFVLKKVLQKISVNKACFITWLKVVNDLDINHETRTGRLCVNDRDDTERFGENTQRLEPIETRQITNHSIILTQQKKEINVLVKKC